MSDDRPRAPTYGPLTIPSAHFLGLVAYHAWCESDQARNTRWERLTEAERRRGSGSARRSLSESAKRPSAVEPSVTICRYRSVRPSGVISIPSTSAVAGTRTRPSMALTTKAIGGCRSSRELAAAALATILQGLHRKLISAAGVLTLGR